MPRHSKMSHKTISMNQNLKELLGLDDWTLRVMTG